MVPLWGKVIVYLNPIGAAPRREMLVLQNKLFQNRRPGSLRCSLKLAGSEGVQAYDERVLGSGQFVEQLRKEKELSERLPVVMPLKELIERIAKAFGMKLEDLKKRDRSQKFADVRSVISYFAVREIGHNGTEVARMLNISRSGVSIAADRGKEFVRKNPSLQKVVKS